MFTAHPPGRSFGVKFIIALTGALFINLLIMVLIPWLFRGGSGQRELPQLNESPVYVTPPELEKESVQTLLEPEPPPEIKLPKVQLQLNQTLPLPEINPEIKLSPVELDAAIENEFSLTPPAVSQPVPAPAAAVAGRDFYRIGELDHEPVSQVRMEPVYPFRARRRGIEGSVKIEFFVTRDGSVAGLKIIKAEPPGFFEKAVRQTVSKWRFKPGMVAGNKVKTLVETTIVFKLGH